MNEIINDIDLSAACDNATHHILGILEGMIEIMSQDEKDFVITYKGKTYNICNPTDFSEKLEQEKMTRKISLILIEKCIRILFKRLKANKLDFDDVWNDVLAFEQGANLDDHKFEKYEEVVADRFDDNGEKVTSIPLDFDSYQVKNDLGFLDDKQDQDMDLH